MENIGRNILKIHLMVVTCFFILFFISNPVLAATINASSCSLSAVQAAINSANPGDTVYVPNTGGGCTWTSKLDWTKGVTLQGANPTNITASSNALINMYAASGNFRLTGFAFSGTGGSPSGGGGEETTLIHFRGTATGVWDSLRVDNCTFTNHRGDYAVTIGDAGGRYIPTHPKALFDHITYSNNAAYPFMKIFGNNNTWWSDNGFGTDWFIFIEDSDFRWSSGVVRWVTDTEMGARFVFRHNTVQNGFVAMHDTGSTQGSRGNRIVEVYENTWLNCIGGGECNNWSQAGVRGGTGVLYNNTMGSGNYAHFTQQVWSGYGGLSAICNRTSALRWNDATRGDMGCGDSINERICSTFRGNCSDGSGTACDFNSDCSGGATCRWNCTSNSQCGSGNTCLERFDNVDGGNDPSGWPVRDQNGRGKDSADHKTQESSPIFVWGNKDNLGNAIGFTENDNFLKEGRDYCNHSPATPCNGVILNYTAFTYPHPLQLGEVGVSVPKGIRIVN